MTDRATVPADPKEAAHQVYKAISTAIDTTAPEYSNSPYKKLAGRELENYFAAYRCAVLLEAAEKMPIHYVFCPAVQKKRCTCTSAPFVEWLRAQAEGGE